MRHCIRPFLAIGALIISCNICHASDSTGVHIKAVLVMVNTQQNKINAFQGPQYHKMLAEVNKDVAGVKNAMTVDFRDNFNYCPVYFFNDSDIDKVLARQFDNVLEDSTGQTVKNPLPSASDTNYLITYYGYPIQQSRVSKTVTDSNRYTANSDAPYGKGLIICNYKMKQVGYLYNLGVSEYIVKIFHRKLMKYTYISKHFDIEYIPGASALNELAMEPEKIHKKHGLVASGLYAPEK